MNLSKKGHLNCKCWTSMKCEICDAQFGIKRILDSYDRNCRSPPKMKPSCPHQISKPCENCAMKK